MSNTAAEGAGCRTDWIHMNPLVVTGGIGKLLDALLRHRFPCRRAELRANSTQQRCRRGVDLRRHACWLDTDTTSPVI